MGLRIAPLKGCRQNHTSFAEKTCYWKCKNCLFSTCQYITTLQLLSTQNERVFWSPLVAKKVPSSLQSWAIHGILIKQELFSTTSHFWVAQKNGDVFGHVPGIEYIKHNQTWNESTSMSWSGYRAANAEGFRKSGISPKNRFISKVGVIIWRKRSLPFIDWYLSRLAMPLSSTISKSFLVGGYASNDKNNRSNIRRSILTHFRLDGFWWYSTER